jgi:putative heme transporter
MKTPAKRGARIALSVASLVLGVAFVVFGLPYVTHVGWSEVLEQLAALPVITLLVLLLLWQAGLWAYTFVFTAALRSLNHTQAYLLNVIGSAVSNLAPFGGAAGVALTFAMTRKWGLARRDVVVAVFVAGIWNALARLALPAIGLAVLVAAGQVPDPRLRTAAAVASIALLVCVVAMVGLFWRESVAVGIGTVLERMARVLPRRWRPRTGRIAASLRRTRHSTIGVVRRAWGQLTLGMFGYLALQCVLFGGCLMAVGLDVGILITVAAFTLSRALSILVVSPGGFGISETGTAALLVALGAAPAAAGAAVLLFGLITFVLEIPLGGVAWIAWTLSGRRAPQEVQAGSRTGDSPRQEPTPGPSDHHDVHARP